MLKKLSLGKKIGLGFTIIGAVLAISTLLTIWQADKTNKLVIRLVELRAPTANASLGMINGINMSLAGLRGWMLLEKPVFKKERANGWTTFINPSTEAMGKLSKNWTDPKNIELLKGINENLKKFEKYQIEIENITQENPVLAKTWLGSRAAPTAFKLKESLEKMNKSQKTLMAKDMKQVKYLATLLSVLCWTLLAVGIVLCFAIAYVVTRSIVTSISRVASGLTQSSEEVAAVSEQVSESAQQMSAGATEQASSLAETVSSVEELSSMVSKNAESAREANSLSESSKTSAVKGEEEIKGLASGMDDISKSSKKIEDIINVIDDISFQTNLLALNAAVEAARAGEQGKGFAVVAEAVRTLAQRSSTAAKEITVLIKESTTKVDLGCKSAETCRTALVEIVEFTRKVADLNAEVSSASQEQASGLSQISEVMNELDQTTQSQASNAVESASSANEMSAQANSLERMVFDLKRLVWGDKKEKAKEEEEERSNNTSRAAGTRVEAPVAVAPRASVTPIRKKNAPLNGGGKAVIPFDEDKESKKKIGNVSGF